ncbi:hypothetical protein VSA01S_13800 [Vibrio sagamiensis NBRC 104589]|uniref:Uncharacterized protein n=1 Tax=Vibrio sagamiensis NBRC 104589 TaxID=1219064 RepID=A0A511QD90_9VIBR|nr:hypothetical protein VSA01S_13800 [Vibrio sagamiensis NBRC 104589]
METIEYNSVTFSWLNQTLFVRQLGISIVNNITFLLSSRHQIGDVVAQCPTAENKETQFTKSLS